MKKTMYLLVLGSACALNGCNESIAPNDFSEEITVERSSRRGEKVDVCHKGSMISVGVNAKDGHLSHGDVLLIPDENGFYPPNECGFATKPLCDIQYLSDFDGIDQFGLLGSQMVSLDLGLGGNGIKLNPGFSFIVPTVTSINTINQGLSKLTFDLAATGQPEEISIIINNQYFIIKNQSVPDWEFDYDGEKCVDFSDLPSSPSSEVVCSGRFGRVQISNIPAGAISLLIFSNTTSGYWSLDNVNLTCSTECI